MPSVNVENATIKTAAVEIKTITVSGKQVTLSVFRQIQEEDIFNEDISLKGIPWGTVNYFWKTDNERDKIHLLWQNGKELRRSVIWRKSSYISYGEPNYIENLQKYSIPFKQYDYKVTLAECNKNQVVQSSKDRIWNIEYLKDEIADGEAGRKMWLGPEFKDIEKAKIQLQQAIDVNETNKHNRDFHKKILEGKCNQYDQLISNFLELPHLFIAV